MIDCKSAISILRSSGYLHTNVCHMDGKVYHDFNSKKRDAAISLVVDESMNSVMWVEITTRKWENGRYVPVNRKVNGLKELKEILG